MSDDLNTEIKIGADASGVEAGVGRAKRSLKDLGDSAQKAGKDAGAGMAAVGAGGDKAAKDVERATKNIQGQLQRAIASFEAGEKGSRKFYESIARQRGVDVNTLKPLLDQLDAYKAKTEAASQASAKASTSFTGLGAAAGLAARAVAAIGISASVGEFIKMADASTNVASRLGLVTSSAAELASVQARLFGIAQSSRVSFTDLVGTYAQVARSTKDLGVSQTALLGVIQTISQAVTISGGSAASAQAALTQLSQGFASGALRGEELNSILEQTPRLAQALADGLGVGVGKLRELGQAGELTAEKVLGALEKSAASVAAEFGKMAVTVEQASTNAANSVLRLVGAFDRLLGVTSAIGGAIQTISNGLDFLSADVEKLGGQGPLRDAAREVINLDAAAKRLRTGMQSGVLGPNAQGELDRINARLAEAKQRFRELDQQLSGVRDPRDQSGFTGRGTSYANEAARQAKLRDDANAFRLNQSGVPASYLKDMTELIRLNQEGVIVGKEYTDALAKQQDLLLKKTTTVRGSAAAANAEQNAYESLISSIRAKIEADNLEIAGGAALTESQRIRIKLDQDLAAGRVKLSAQNERAVRLALEELSASEASALAAKTLAKANLDAAASRDKYLTSLSTGLDKIQADIAAQIEATERMGLSKEAIAELDAAKLEMLATDLELQAIKAMDRNLDQQTYDALKKQAAAYRELGIAKKGGAAKEAALEMEKANAEAAKKAQEDWERAAEQINGSLTDALLRGFESGKDFAKNLRDTVVNMFKTMVLRPVISAIINPISGAITGALGLSGAANAAGQVGGIGSIVGGASNLLGLGGLGGFTSGFLSGGSQAMLGASFVGPPASAAGGAIGAGGMLGAAAPWLAGIAAIAASWKKLFGRELKDSGIEGQFGGDTGFEGRSYKFYEGGVFRSDKTEYSALDETLRKTLGDTFDAMQMQVTSFADALGLNADKIGTFTSDIKLSLRGLSEQDAQAKIQEALATVNDQLAQEILGSWTTVSKEVERIVWQSATVNDQPTTTVREMVESREYTPSEYAREGEKAIDTLTRLATSLTTVNDVFETLGVTLLEASLSGGDAASALADAFGGLENLVAATQDYYQNFYSEDERKAQLQSRLDKEFEGLGIDTPKTREEFRKLVDDALNQVEVQRAGRDKIRETIGSGISGKLNLEDLGKSGILDNVDPSLYGGGAANPEVAGKLNDFLQGVNDLADKGLDPDTFDKGLADLVALNSEVLGMGKDAATTAAALIGLSGTFAQVTESAEDAQRRIEEARKAAQDAALRDFRRAVDRDRSALQDQASALRDSIGAIADAVDMLRGNASELYNTVSTTAQMQAAQGMVYVENALAGVLAGGSVTDYTGLTDAIAAARGGIDSGVYATQFDRERDALVLAGQLTTLADVSDMQLSVEERQLRAINEQLEYLDTLSKRAEEMVNGTTALTETVDTYFARLMGILDPEKPEGDAGKPGSGGAAGGGAVWGPGGGGGSAAGSAYKRPVSLGTGGTGYSPVTDAAEVSKLNELASVYHSFDGTGDLTGLLTAIRDAGGTISDLEALSGYYQSDWRKAAESVGIPAFAVGTNYVPRDMLARIHEGEAIVPKAYNPWANGQAMQGGDPELLAEMRAMRAELAALRAASAATANNTAGLPQMADQFDTVTNGGNAMRAKALA